ncbi:MAG: co-chaperone YbbN [Pseudomonadota bacterium]
MSQFAFDVDASNFQSVVLEGSMNVPVVVDFWAPWCGPCKSLKPILEKLAEEFQGKFILAKVNADDNQELAAQFGVRGIPDVKAVYQGKIVDQFSGALPESAVREFLARIIPSPADELRAKAADQRADGDLAGALQTLGEASRLDAQNEDVRIDAADILLDLEEADEAKRLLDSLSPVKQMDDRVQRLRAKLAFAQGGQTEGDETELRNRIAAQPDDMEPRMDLANLLIASGRHQEGLDTLLDMVRLDRTWNEEAARKQILAVFNLLGAHPLVSEYRRKLASALN